MCGKSLRATTKPSVGSGSPPRVREKPTNLLKLILKLRITPAYAGKTSCVLSSGLRDRDHPRMCGKNHKANTSICVCLGSPPRVREKLISSNSSSRNTRITPACAGKTQTETSLPCLIRDHPRVCGKNSSMANITPFKPGSPPRVREKQRIKVTVSHADRITPACAGKTACSCNRLARSQDHPRMCGKNNSVTGTINFNVGSPPRVREKPEAIICTNFGYGITPASAGKTFRKRL